MRDIPLDVGVLHFVGIGGIGMSGIAEILHSLNHDIQGSDIAENANVKRLRGKGIEIFIGHSAENLIVSGDKKIAAVVVSSAIKKDNPELVAAREAKIPIVKRADMLAELMRLKWAIAVGGTHGKTTTTSLIGAVLEEADKDPTVINGGIIHAYGTNTRLGKSEWMVVESDESDGTFTRLPATITVVTNIDPEHMESYNDFEDVKNSYRKFVENIPFYGYGIMCIDHPVVQSLIPTLTDRKIITYGFSTQADIQAVDLSFCESGATFSMLLPEEKGERRKIKDIFLAMPGEHNVQNALAAIAVGYELGISDTILKKSLRHFQGVSRRFTKTGEAAGITVIDDYGHHPVEIAAVLKAARQMVEKKEGRVLAVMQPHRYSRLHGLMDDFSTCFNEAHSVIVTDVYAAGESPIEGADKNGLVEKIKSCGHRDASALENRENLAEIILEKARPGDMVVCLGAGDITHWAKELPTEIDKLHKDKGRNAG